MYLSRLQTIAPYLKTWLIVIPKPTNNGKLLQIAFQMLDNFNTDDPYLRIRFTKDDED